MKRLSMRLVSEVRVGVGSEIKLADIKKLISVKRLEDTEESTSTEK